MNQLLVVFAAVFLAELGDKTQVATMLFASSGDHSPWFVFVAASLALIASSAIAVLLGSAAERYLTEIPLNLIAGSALSSSARGRSGATSQTRPNRPPAYRSPRAATGRHSTETFHRHNALRRDLRSAMT